MKKLIYVLTMVVFINMITSCHNNTADPEPDPAVVTGNVKMHLHTYINDIDEVDGYNITYTTAAGRHVSLSIAQFYLSDIRLVKSDGSEYALPSALVLKVLDLDTYTIGDVPAGNYKSIRFKIGLDPTNNLKVPSNVATDPLNHSEMWFGANAQPEGYVFLNVQGSIDTTAAMNGTLIPFEYKIGTNANYIERQMPDNNYTVAPGQTTYIHMKADASKLFSGIDLTDNTNLHVSTVADNATSIATAIKNNIPGMFLYE